MMQLWVNTGHHWRANYRLQLYLFLACEIKKKNPPNSVDLFKVNDIYK